MSVTRFVAGAVAFLGFFLLYSWLGQALLGAAP